MAHVFEERIRIDAPLERVWEALVDVDAWPAWTASMKRVQRLDEGPLRMDSRVKLWLRGSMSGTTWTVTSFERGRSFSWTSCIMPGVTSIAGHELTPADGGADVLLRVTYEGPLAGIVARVLDKTSRENMRMEAEGLKRVAEAAAHAAGTGSAP